MSGKRVFLPVQCKRHGGQGSFKRDHPGGYGFTKPLSEPVSAAHCLFPFSLALLIFH